MIPAALVPLLLFFVKAVESCLAGDYADCATSTKQGSFCCLDGNLANPTQFAIGFSEARCKQGHFEAMSDKEVQKYLADHPVPVVIGPTGFYITDHHHLIAGLLWAKLDSTHRVLANVTENWSDLSRNDFLRKMTEENKVWLYSEKGIAPMNPLALPMLVTDLPNDPYRSLAGQVADAGGFLNDGTLFCQFQWANYFRDANLLPAKESPTTGSVTYTWCETNPYDAACFDEMAALSNALPKALEMCKSQEAQHLCGYSQGVVSPANCGKQSNPVASFLLMKGDVLPFTAAEQ